MSSTSSERTSLLPNGDRRHFSESDNNFFQRTSLLFKAEGQPSHYASWKFFLFGSWTNVLLVFVPLSIIAHNLDLDAALRFSFSFFAIVPLASVSSSVGLLNYSLNLCPVVAFGYCDRRNVSQTWSNSCWTVKCFVWKCGRNYCWYRCAHARFGFTRRSSSLLLNMSQINLSLCKTPLVPNSIRFVWSFILL
jgi:hypothetical protein